LRVSLSKISSILFIGSLLSLLLVQCADQMGTQESKSEYVGSETCASCHSSEYKEWQDSHHYHAMELPSPKSVKGDFSGVSFVGEGDSSYFYQLGNEYWVNYTAINAQTDSFKIAYTFGWIPLQQYLVKTRKGRVQTLRASWNTEKKQWFHQYKGDTINLGEYMHWQGQSMTWNTMCADCHSTNVQKNYMPKADSFHTTYSEITVGCEGCHGPASNHVVAAQQGKNVSNTLRLTASLSNVDQVNQCGSCHMRRTVLGDSHMLGDFWNEYLPHTINNNFYHADGQILEEDYVWGSFVQSKMYHEGVRCTDCHNPHTNALKFEGNKLCLQCHEPRYNTLEHHKHELDTESAQCINCHMTGKHYMGNDFRRDHSFRIPRPDLSVNSDIPNACNGCHTNQSTSWAENKLTGWYGEPRTNYADVLTKHTNGELGSNNELLELVQTDTAPVIARATALEYALQYPSNNLVQIIEQQIHNPEMLIRIQALEALNNAPKELRIKHGLTAMKDSLQPIRNVAAMITADLRQNEVPASEWARWQTVQKEYLNYLNHQADFREGRMALAQYAVRQQRWNSAIVHYKQALRFDKSYTPAYAGWATALAQSNQLVASLELLKMASKTYPQDVRLHYLTGITAYELKQIKDAITHLEQAVALSDYFPQYVQNLVLIYTESGNIIKAKQVVEIALVKYPGNPQLIELQTYVERLVITS